MWKALIKLVEKWAYRCEHDWELVHRANVLDREMYAKGVEISRKVVFTYVCRKCMKTETVQSAK